MPELHAPADRVAQVLGILERHAPGRAVYAFGSRVRGTHRPTSDLDVCLRGPVLAVGEMAALREALEESDLPFPVDVVEWERIGDGFRRLIEGEFVALRVAS